MLLVVVLSSLQIQRITENMSNCSIPSPSVHPLRHSMPLSETPKKKTQKQSLAENKQITSQPTSPEDTNAGKPHTPSHFPKIDVSLTISTHPFAH